MRPIRRDVAQPGSALDWGSRGRWFESSHPDQFHRSGHTGDTRKAAPRRFQRPRVPILCREKYAAVHSSYSSAVIGGVRQATSRDHVPPENLFAAPRPSNLIAVPACAACHGDTSKDDEYFRTVMALRADIHNHPDIQGGVLSAAMRSLSRPEAVGLAKALLRTVREVPVRTPAGLYAGTVGSYTAEGERVFRVVERITRGLFFHHMHRTLRTGHVKVLHDDFVDWSILPKDVVETAQRVTRAVAQQQTRHRVGRAFEYAYLITENGEMISAWLMTFFDRRVSVDLIGLKQAPSDFSADARSPRAATISR